MPYRPDPRHAATSPDHFAGAAAAWTPTSQFARGPTNRHTSMRVLAAERDHALDLVVGLQHDAAALADAVNRDDVLAAAASTASIARGPSHDGISTRYCPPSANRLARGRQVVRVPCRKIQCFQDVCRCSHGSSSDSSDGTELQNNQPQNTSNRGARRQQRGASVILWALWPTS